MEIIGLEHGRIPSYTPPAFLSGARAEEDLQEGILSCNPNNDSSQRIYTNLPVAKTSQLITAERVHYICHCCGKLIWADESRKITSGETEGEKTPKITIEHSLCHKCKQDYLGWDG